MQTILGANGAIGTELARELTHYTSSIRLVSRNPKSVSSTDQLFPADLTDRAQVMKAVEGSEVVYITIGFQYSAKVWQQKWPTFMRNTIDACIAHNARLVFFDNIYMYDRNHLSNMTEETPIRPTSKKGEVRAQIAQMILDEVAAGKLNALIARAADFFSPKNSVLVEMVYKNLAKGKKANLFANANKLHNYTYSVDAAKGTAMLGNTPSAFGQVWHLPTSRVRLTGKQWVELIAKEMKVEPRYSVLPKWMMSLAGLFVPVIGEFKEMVYQYDRDYLFNSEKFEQQFGYHPATPEEMVRQLVAKEGIWSSLQY